MDEMCLEMCKITRWERGYRLILDRVDFSVRKKEKVLIRGEIQEDIRQEHTEYHVRVSYRSNFRIWSG